jgi:hypothetical protein
MLLSRSAAIVTNRSALGLVLTDANAVNRLFLARMRRTTSVILTPTVTITAISILNLIAPLEDPLRGEARGASHAAKTL